MPNLSSTDTTTDGDASGSLPAPILDLVKRVRAKSVDSVERQVEIANLLEELRRRVESDLGVEDFEDWAKRHLGLRRSRLGDYRRIAKAKYQREEAKRQLEKNAKRQRAFRQKQKPAYVFPENRAVMKWARTASRQDAAFILEIVRKRRLQEWRPGD